MILPAEIADKLPITRMAAAPRRVGDDQPTLPHPFLEFPVHLRVDAVGQALAFKAGEEVFGGHEGHFLAGFDAGAGNVRGR